MSPTFSRPFLRLAVIGALVACLGLAACGRKGPLDSPPGAAAAVPHEEQAPRSGLSSSPVSMSPLGGQAGGQPISPDDVKGPKRKIPLDVLLN